MARPRSEKPQQPIIRDPFAVIPIRPDAVEVKQDSRGMIHLRLTVAPKGWAKKFADWLRYDYTRKIELDEYGTFYYARVDGATTLSSIIDQLAAHLGHTREEAAGMVMLFTKKLMVMNMLALKVPPEAQWRPSDKRA